MVITYLSLESQSVWKNVSVRNKTPVFVVPLEMPGLIGKIEAWNQTQNSSFETLMHGN